MGRSVGFADEQICEQASRGGGALRYQMATHCQMAVHSGSGENQNIGAVNSFGGKKKKKKKKKKKRGWRSTSN